jgi:Peptidase S46
MNKSLLAFTFFSAAVSTALANEGMWMPKQLPQIQKDLKAAGLKLAPSSLTQLTEFPMGAIVSLGGCSASFVSPQGLVITNHHCVYNSVAHNSTPERNLIENGFLATTLKDELPAAPGSRVYVTKDVRNVSSQVIDPATALLKGKKRVDAIEKNQKALVAECEKDQGHRCTVASFYGGLEFYLIKQLEIRDVRLVHAPAKGVGNFGGETDNWMWPRHTGDYGFYRAYVSRDGKPAEYSTDNVPYQPQHFLKIAKEGMKEGDFVMALGYPGRTNRHRLPSEVSSTFDWSYPNFVQNSAETLAIIERETKDKPDIALKYANQVTSIKNYYKNRQGMIASYAKSDLLSVKTAQHAELKAWVLADATRKKEYAQAFTDVEQSIAARDDQIKRDFYLDQSSPRLLSLARRLYRLACESEKADMERKPGYQTRDLPRIKAGIAAIERSYDTLVDQALVMNNLVKYAALPASQRNADFDKVMGIRDGMNATELKQLLENLYAGSKLADPATRMAWMEKSRAEFEASDDRFIKAAVALHPSLLKQEAEEEELAGKIQESYASYMKAKIAFMNSKGQAIYPDANGTLRITFGKIAGRPYGADGTTWTAFTTVDGIAAKATGTGDFNAPAAQLAEIKARNFGEYVHPQLKSVPVNFLATMDITGGNSGSAILNSKAELVGLVFDGTLDSIISDWRYNQANTRSIQVDARYILWQMQYVDHAKELLKELGMK